MQSGIWSGPGTGMFSIQASLPESGIHYVQGSNQFASTLGQLLYINPAIHVGGSTVTASLTQAAPSTAAPAQTLDANAVILALLQQQQKIAQLEMINKQLSLGGLLPHASLAAQPAPVSLTTEPRSTLLVHTQYPGTAQQQQQQQPPLPQPNSFQLLVQPQQLTTQAGPISSHLAALLAGIMPLSAPPAAQAPAAAAPSPSSAPFPQPGGQSALTVLRPTAVQVVSAEAGAPVRQHSGTSSSTGTWAQAQHSPAQQQQGQQVGQDSGVEGSQHACTALMALAQACDQDAATAAGAVPHHMTAAGSFATTMAGLGPVMATSVAVPGGNHQAQAPVSQGETRPAASQQPLVVQLVGEAAAAQPWQSLTAAGAQGHNAVENVPAAPADQQGGIQWPGRLQSLHATSPAWYSPPPQKPPQPQQQRKRQRHPAEAGGLSALQVRNSSEVEHGGSADNLGSSRKRPAVAAEPYTGFKGGSATLSDADAQYLLFSWSMAELQALLQLVNELGDGCWEAVAERLNARFSGGIRPGPSSSSYPPGDCLLLGEIYSQQQQQRRTSSSKGPGERSPAECKERWSLHVTPAGRKEGWSLAEEIILIEAHKVVGNKWSEISRLLKGRADNTVKNHYNTALRRKHPGRTWNFACSILDAYQVSMGLKSFPNGAREQQLKQLYASFMSGTDVCIPPLPASAVLQLEELYRRHQTTHHLTGYGHATSLTPAQLTTSQLLQEQIKRVHSGAQQQQQQQQQAAGSSGSPPGPLTSHPSHPDLLSPSVGPSSPASTAPADTTEPRATSGSAAGPSPSLTHRPASAATTPDELRPTSSSGAAQPPLGRGHIASAFDQWQPAGVAPTSTPAQPEQVAQEAEAVQVAVTHALAPAGSQQQGEQPRPQQQQSNNGVAFVCRVVEEVKQAALLQALIRPVASTPVHNALPTVAPATVPLPA